MQKHVDRDTDKSLRKCTYTNTQLCVIRIITITVSFFWLHDDAICDAEVVQDSTTGDDIWSKFWLYFKGLEIK
ncbi:hypothetical protein ROHU_027610 [Labeo rohita]|uniref:Uncharacterized protein n=1 Tax=Labeo rohita TaxID=84645 RepID=A0A498M6L1_LABRO|nr:hypothetical protein ROHU_027610 [Labeo rohita]